ncbi:hypothetical protein BEP19_07570 [Ammoniphilus oxalaticus]|uniref:Protein-glutamate methylesterase/protein-glutamine glutaminase n=1 Tax=Ammoniphilus oxalaticus TaxID=66863 RepID=A0A419SJP1_9BACL|nr:chemotaxis response regulator protein-glutamate methylesterase [Ammoniphilus oxalaticus]RKD24254.1 hypothetical protein BEP19_07570 [Ammoniphilus oxalaticus]
MRKTKVLVVDDSAFMRKVLSEILSTDAGIEVVGTARNGQDAIAKVAEIKPDVVTMDIEMPKMDGIEALRFLMENNPLPIVMISSLTQQGADATVQALELGAIDFISKPSGAISLDIHKVKEQIIEKVKSAAQANPKRIMAVLKRDQTKINVLNQREPRGLLQTATTSAPHLIVIGVSTGGPNALKCLLEELPEDFPAALFIVQHMPARFTKSLARRLNDVCELQVREAEQGVVAQAGYAYIAPGDYHMEIRARHRGGWQIELNQDDPVGSHRPSVDKLFESVSKLNHPSKIAIILTGMGSDGTKGLELMKQSGCREAIAEAESSCVIFGMPRAAIHSGNIDRILPIHEIGPYLTKKLINRTE